MTTRSPGAPPIWRAAITNLGCKVNQAEMDAVERLLRARGVGIATDAARADLHLVNTCTVTAAADDKSRKAVRRARRASPAATVIVTGCAVQVARASFAEMDPAARLVANEAKDGLLAEVERLLGEPGQAGDGPPGDGLPGDGRTVTAHTVRSRRRFRRSPAWRSRGSSTAVRGSTVLAPT